MPRPHQLKKLWLHWTVAHAAGLGTLAGWRAVYEWSQREAHDVRQNDTAFFVVGAPSIFMFLACLQQFMLRSAGWCAPLWAVCTVLGMLIGGFCGAIAGDIVWHSCAGVGLPRIALLWLFGTTFTAGAVLGGIQFFAVSGSRQQHVIWMIASGVAMFAAPASVIPFPRFPFIGPEAMIPVATIMGGCYGLITGGALVYLLTREQQRHRRDSAAGSE